MPFAGALATNFINQNRVLSFRNGTEKIVLLALPKRPANESLSSSWLELPVTGDDAKLRSKYCHATHYSPHLMLKDGGLPGSLIVRHEDIIERTS